MSLIVCTTCSRLYRTGKGVDRKFCSKACHTVAPPPATQPAVQLAQSFPPVQEVLGKIYLEIGNSLCNVSNIPKDRLVALTKECSYRERTGKTVRVNTKSGPKWVPEILTRRLLDRDGNFPTGLLKRVVAFLTSNGWEFKVSDLRIRPQTGLESLSATFPYLPRKEQLEAATAAYNASRGIISSPTGTGKSAICALIIDRFKVKTLVVAPGLGLKFQLMADLKTVFGEHKVGELKEGKLISVENVQGLASSPALKGIHCVIIDEFHHGAAETYRELNLKAWKDVYFKIGLTATPFRGNKDDQLLLESLLSDIIYTLDYATAVDKGYIVPVEAYYIDLPLNPKRKNFNSYHAAYKALVVDNELRNNIIADLSANLIDQGKSTIILTKQIEHGNKLQELLEERGHQVNFAEGKNELKTDHIEAFCQLEETALLGTVGVLGEGIDTRPCEYVIIAGGGKSKTQFMQAIGRGLRNFNYPHGSKESCKVILIQDQNNPWFLRHYLECCRHLLEEYGVTPIKLDLGT